MEGKTRVAQNTETGTDISFKKKENQNNRKDNRRLTLHYQNTLMLIWLYETQEKSIMLEQHMNNNSDKLQHREHANETLYITKSVGFFIL